MKYGIDLDGVCFDFLNAFRGQLNDSIGCDLKEEEITSYYWYENAHEISKDAFFYEFDEFGKNGGYRNLELLPGTQEALARIAKAGHEIFYITNRPKYAVRDTICSLNEHNFPFRNNLFFAEGDKSKMVKGLKIDVFIDDSARTVEDLALNTEAKIYCRAYKHNAHLDCEWFPKTDRQPTMVTNWSHFLLAEGFLDECKEHCNQRFR